MINDLSLLPQGKKVYFVSDLHLGSPGPEESLKREKLMVDWLNSIEEDAHSIFFVGDIFDFWFEYKYVIPKGYVRFLGTISQLKDKGINIYFFAGNHDMWMFDYFPSELDIPVIPGTINLSIGDCKILVGHGDGLGKGDRGYKIIKSIFSNPFCQWLFARIHPNLGIRIANYWSRKSRNSSSKEIPVEKDRLVNYCKEIESSSHYDYYIFGHRHKPETIELEKNSTYINLGDWIDHFTYAEFSQDKLELKSFSSPK